jgi:hypothetical protein
MKSQVKARDTLVWGREMGHDSYYILFVLKYYGRDSLVVIPTCYSSQDIGSNPEKGNFFFLLHRGQTHSGINQHHILLAPDAPFHLMARSKMVEIYLHSSKHKDDFTSTCVWACLLLADVKLFATRPE